MRIHKNTFGFAAAEGILIVVVLALIGVVGYKVYTTKTSTDKINNDIVAVSSQSNQVSVVKVPSVINSTSDLDKAQQALENYDTNTQDATDTNQLDKQLATF